MPGTLLVSAALALSACTPAHEPARTDPQAPAFAIRWGVSAGMCRGYCAAEMEVVGTRARLTQWDPARPRRPRVDELKITEGEWHALLELMKASDIDGLPDRIGCPDCTDGGAEYVEFQRETTRKRVVFDGFDGGPESLQPVLQELRALGKRFRH